MTATTTSRTLKLWQNRIETEVEISGTGPALVYLHGPWGVAADRPFIDELAKKHTVYAPKHPGTSPGNHEAIHAVDAWLDLIVYYGELFDRLEFERPTIVGHSFGALVACEYAAATPRAVGKLALINPVGLWRDDLPVRNWMLIGEPDRRGLLFSDSESAACKRFFDVPADQAGRIATVSQFIWSQACTGKFVWPIADRGLKLRIHRVAAPTLIVWGKADRIIAPAYAEEFSKRIAGSKIEMIDSAGHCSHVEQPAAVARAVTTFLGR